MTGHETADDRRSRSILAMGSDLREVYCALWEELAHLYGIWLTYVELFGTKSERVHLLNKAGPFVVRTIQDVMWERVLLDIANLTSRPRSAGNPLLTVCRLPELIAARGDDRQDADNAVQKAVASASFARDWRHRHIAHKNLELSLQRSALPLAPASRADVKSALQEIASVLNLVSGKYLQGATAFDRYLGIKDDAYQLLLTIYDGVRVAEERRQSRRSNPLDFRLEDYNLPDL